MRNDPAIPAAIVRLVTVTGRRTQDEFSRYRVTTWTVDSACEERRLLGYFRDLDSADFLAGYAAPVLTGVYAGPPNGGRA